MFNKSGASAASYLKLDCDSNSREFDETVSSADVSPELSRGFRSLKVWLPLVLYGVEPFKAALKGKILLTRSCYEEVKELGFAVRRLQFI